MSNVPTNLIPTKITGLLEYTGSSTLGYIPYVLEGRTYKVQFANIAAVGAVPSTREINTGSGLGGGGDLSANRTLYILPEGVDDSRLTTTGVAAGTYGAANSVPVFNVNAQGRVTGVTDTPIVLSNYVPTSRTITAGVGLSGGGDLSANRTFEVNFSSTTPEPLGIGSPGVSTVAAREDHVHPAVDLSDTTETQGVLPLSRGGTGNSLSPVVGAVAYSSNDKLYLTPTAGSAGQVLTSDGGAGAPYWTTITGTGTVTSVNLTAGTGISVSGGPITTSGSITVVNTAPDQIVSLTGAGGTSISGTYPNFTITSSASSGTVTSVDGSGGATGLTLTGGPITTSGTLTLGGTLAIANGGTGATSAAAALTSLGAYPASNPSGFTSNVGTVTSANLIAGTGISVSGGPITTSGSITVVNTAPDQVVSLTAGTNVTITGTYPSFTIAASGGSGTVTSVDGSGGTTGLTLTGGPITTSGTLTLGGTLAIANGGTGATEAATALTNLGAYPASNPSGFTSNTGTVTSVGGTGTVNGITLTGTVTTSGSLTLGGTLSGVSLTTQVSGTLPIANGGTGQTTYTDGQLLIGDSTGNTLSKATLTAGSGITITNGAGSITIASTSGGGSVTSVDGSGGTTGLTLTGGPITTSGTLTLGGTLTVANGGTGASTLTGIVVGNGTSAFTTVTAPSGAVVGTTDTQTLTNKRVTPRMNSQSTTSSPWAWNSDSYDIQAFTALANALTINADAGTPTDGQRTVLRFKDNGTARALTWTTGSTNAFRAVGVTLPTTTVVGKVTYVGCLYNAFDSRWDAVAVSQEA